MQCKNLKKRPKPAILPFICIAWNRINNDEIIGAYTGDKATEPKRRSRRPQFPHTGDFFSGRFFSGDFHTPEILMVRFGTF